MYCAGECILLPLKSVETELKFRALVKKKKPENEPKITGASGKCEG